MNKLLSYIIRLVVWLSGFSKFFSRLGFCDYVGWLLRRIALRKAGLNHCSQLLVGSAPISEELLMRSQINKEKFL